MAKKFHDCKHRQQQHCYHPKLEWITEKNIHLRVCMAGVALRTTCLHYEPKIKGKKDETIDAKYTGTQFVPGKNRAV